MKFEEQDDYDLNLGHPWGEFDDNYEDNRKQHDLTKYLKENPRYYDSEKFVSLWHSLHDGQVPSVDPLFVKANIDLNYETERFYHNQNHIESLLLEFDKLKKRKLIINADEFELAIYVHDLIYDTRSKDNELQSASWISNILKRSGVKEEKIERVRSLILASDHKSVPINSDARYFVDLDLSIFGKSEEDYVKYAEAIRKEYSWVGEEDYIKGRKQVLNYFLLRKPLYHTALFRDKYQFQAELNLKAEINSLSK